MGPMIEIGKRATGCGIFPLYDVEEGHYRVTRKGAPFRPVTEYFQPHGRFAHLGPDDLANVQVQVTADWERFLRLEDGA
jgi:pyruvate/2-oxoacid:ferredoxin oxidoreductase beta subunit